MALPSKALLTPEHFSNKYEHFLLLVRQPVHWLRFKLFTYARKHNKTVEKSLEEGKIASAYTKDLLTDKEVIVIADPKDKKDNFKGFYNRTIGYAHVPLTTAEVEDSEITSDCYVSIPNEESTYLDVQAVLLSKGLAESSVFPHERKELYDRLQKEAKKSKRGIWASTLNEENTMLEKTKKAYRTLKDIITV